ncbi:hypothetical protein BDW74DRAFT_180085 [Aspergillus multicolor]|uniref:DUF3716 domain-containing protein n=1 Tax=Aspergillus multicolor TaxID=41759 RepID=UPI003CCDAF4B
MAYATRRSDDLPEFFVYRPVLSRNLKGSKRPLDDDFALQPIYTAARKRASTEPKGWLSGSSTQLTGLDSDDLPYAPSNTTHPAILHYLDLPVQRKLDWRLDYYGMPKRRDLAYIKSLVSAFAQTRGDIAEAPCTACQQGKGPWTMCVARSDMVDGVSARSCANCRFSARPGCSLSTYLTYVPFLLPLMQDPVTSDDNDSVRASVISETPRDIQTYKAQTPYLTPPGTEKFSVMPSTPPRDAQTYEPETPSLTPPVTEIRKETSTRLRLFLRPSDSEIGNATANTDSMIIKSEMENSPAPAQRVSSRHEGKVIPFPLDPSIFNDLALLKVAAVDLAAHFALVERRINQLEEEELKKKDIVNPWDLL